MARPLVRDHVDVDVLRQRHHGLADAPAGEETFQPTATARTEDQLGGVLQAAAVLVSGAGDALQSVELRLGVPAPVALDEAGHHVRTAGRPAVGLVEHPVGLADAGGGPEEDLESSGAGDGRPSRLRVRTRLRTRLRTRTRRRFRAGGVRGRHRQNFSGKNTARIR